MPFPPVRENPSRVDQAKAGSEVFAVAAGAPRRPRAAKAGRPLATSVIFLVPKPIRMSMCPAGGRSAKRVLCSELSHFADFYRSRRLTIFLGHGILPS